MTSRSDGWISRARRTDVAIVQIPHNWRPRHYQLKAWAARERGIKRFIFNWHRRCGKDAFALNGAACDMIDRPGTYWHMLPKANQVRKAIWDALDETTGKRILYQIFPAPIVEDWRETDMFIRLKNGATLQFVGSDNYDNVVGSPPVGVTFSEWALARPQAWDYIRPILTNNGGIASFISTPRGQNHHARMYNMALKEKAWFAQTLTVADTGVFTLEQIARERRELAAVRGDVEAESIIQQEYYCSFAAAIPGSYYGPLIEKMDSLGMIVRDQRLHVHGIPIVTYWDLGRSDSTCIWFVQYVGGQVRVIDYFEGSTMEVEDYAAVMKKKETTLGYVYGRTACVMPHDGGHKRLGMGNKSIAEQMDALGFRTTVLTVDADLIPAINATRAFLKNCWFDCSPRDEYGEGWCDRGLDGLKAYHREWDEDRQVFKGTPEHDWASHPADGFRTLARGFIKPQDAPRQTTAASDYVMLS